jgi:hypothetical protein
MGNETDDKALSPEIPTSDLVRHRVLLGLVTGCENFLKRAVAMRRYLIAAVVAEVIALVVWLLFFRSGPNDAIVFDSVGRIATPSGCLNMDIGIEREFLRLDMQARQLAFQLDFLNTSAPLVIGLPAIAVLSLWTFDRRRKQKQPGA